jgi:hypothetical protein
MEELFYYIPDVVAKLTGDAPSLLPVLLEGLVWRSRHTKNGTRRVNYYVKYFFIDHDGKLSGALKALVSAQDPKIMSDPVIVTVSDTMWNQIASRQFILRKAWFILSLLVFMMSQAVLPNLKVSGDALTYTGWGLLAGRSVNYLFGMCGLGFRHGKIIIQEYRDKDTIQVFGMPVPRNLGDKSQAAGFGLFWLLLLMMSQEPILYCVGSDKWPTEICAGSESVEGRYQVLSMIAMAMHWFLMVDMAVFSTGLSAFVLVCKHVLSEVSRFLIALLFLLLTFASAMSTLRHEEYPQFRDVWNCVLTLFAITILRYEGDYREIIDEPMLLGCIFVFVLASGILLVNLLIAQINCSYQIVYNDMIGYARLNRASCIVETLESVSRVRWDRFVAMLALDTPLEFNDGDLAFGGGIATVEPAADHPTVEDLVHRYGGSCSPEMRWPEETVDLEEDQYERLERLVRKVMKRMSAYNKARKAAKKDGGGGSGLDGTGDSNTSGSVSSAASEFEQTMGTTVFEADEDE